MRREIRHVARQGYRDFEGIPTRPTDRPRQLIHPFSRRPETSSRLTSLRRTFSSMAPLVPNNRSDWSQAASASCLDPPKRGMPNSCCGAEGRKECPLPSSFLTITFLPAPPRSSFPFPCLEELGSKRASEEGKGKEGRSVGRSVGRHRRPLFSSEVGRAEEIKKCYRVAVAVVLDGVGPERAFPNRRLCEGGIGLITD